MGAERESPTETGPRPRGAVLVVAGVCWLAAVAVGMHALARYKNAPGDAASPPARWPADSALPRSPARATLLLFAHPWCPCSRASVAELARLTARAGDRVRAQVLFEDPGGLTARARDSALWRAAEAIPGVRVALDEDHREARRFRARTSGDVLVYSAAGALRFHGGITAARGHEGDGPGGARALRWITEGRADRGDAPVFGCALGLGPEPRGASSPAVSP